MENPAAYNWLFFEKVYFSYRTTIFTSTLLKNLKKKIKLKKLDFKSRKQNFYFAADQTTNNCKKLEKNNCACNNLRNEKNGLINKFKHDLKPIKII